MRKIFIDGGAHRGQSAEVFMNRWPGAEEYEIYSFEAGTNVALWDELSKVMEKYPNMSMFQSALWIKNEDIVFYDEGNSSSSLIQAKLARSPGHEVKKVVIEAIDLGGWLDACFDDDDEIIVKLNVEGAEYEILEQMLDRDQLKKVNTLFVDLHGSKCGKTFEETVALMDRLRDAGHIMYAWSADENFDYETFKETEITKEFMKKKYAEWSERGYDELIRHRELLHGLSHSNPEWQESMKQQFTPKIRAEARADARGIPRRTQRRDNDDNL